MFSYNPVQVSTTSSRVLFLFFYHHMCFYIHLCETNINIVMKKLRKIRNAIMFLCPSCTVSTHKKAELYSDSLLYTLMQLAVDVSIILYTCCALWGHFFLVLLLVLMAPVDRSGMISTSSCNKHLKTNLSSCAFVMKTCERKKISEKKLKSTVCRMHDNEVYISLW